MFLNLYLLFHLFLVRLVRQIREVVVAVPADFSALQREALKEAAQMGGMRVKQLLPQPTSPVDATLRTPLTRSPAHAVDAKPCARR